MKWEAAVARLYSLERRGIKLDLDRVRACLEALGRPPDAWPAILVAGTNGKGSTSAALASILARTGRRIGLYTSPHLLDFRERIRVDGRLADAEALLERLERDWETWERFELSFFEAATMLAFSHFRDAGVELAVLEVGMGGRLDATNTVEPILSIITSLGMDHAHALGPTGAAIAREKAGILRPGVPAVMAGGVPGAPGAVVERARELGSPLFRRRECLSVRGQPEGAPGEAPAGARSLGPVQRFHLSRRESAPEGFRWPVAGLEVETTLAGAHQCGNLALAALSAAVLRESGTVIEDAAIAQGIARLRWPGRLERPCPGERLVADVAHNREGARVLGRALRATGETTGWLPVVGMLAQKDHAGFFRELRRIATRVFLAPLQNERAAPLEELHEAARKSGLAVTLFPSVAEALDAARGEARRAGGPSVVLCGSFHTLDEGYRRLGVSPAAALWEDPA